MTLTIDNINIDELIVASIAGLEAEDIDIDQLDNFINAPSQHVIECEDGIVPPPALFADGQSTAAVGSYLPCAPNTFSNAAKTAVSQDVNNVAQLPATGQYWTGTGLNWMQQWLDKSIPQYDGSSHIDERSSPVVGGFSEASNLHLSPVGLVNEESCLGDVSEAPAQFPRELYVQQGLEPVSLADLLCVTSCTSDSPPDIITDSQQALQLISTHNPASQPPGRQQNCFPYTPPESGSEVNSPPNYKDLFSADQSSSSYHSFTNEQEGHALAHESAVKHVSLTQPVTLQSTNAVINSAASKPAKRTGGRHLRDATTAVYKKRKHADTSSSSSSATSATTLSTNSPLATVKQELDEVTSDHSDDDVVFVDGNSMVGATAQGVRWSHYQPTTWTSLLDEQYHEIGPVVYVVEADKGFNYLSYDDSFVCQKKNHFQVTVYAGLSPGSARPQFVYDGQACIAVPIDGFYLHFHGIKRELPSYRIQVEQSTPDRIKHVLQPVRVTLSAKDHEKVVVGRLHFSETTSNNMRKRGKPNPDQRYFQLVISLYAHHGSAQYLIAAHISDKIIVRASNPGQFEGDADMSWMRGKSIDSVYHMGSVGINTDQTDEALTVHGNVRLTGKLVSPSDVRAKTDLEELDSNRQLENISKLKVYSYKFTDEYADYAGLPATARHDTGVLAQDLSEVLPDAVSRSHNVSLPGGDIHDFLVVNKDRIFFENIGAVKELCKVTGKLEMRISEMEAMNRRLSKHGRTASTKSSQSLSSTASSLHSRRQKETDSKLQSSLTAFSASRAGSRDASRGGSRDGSRRGSSAGGSEAATMTGGSTSSCASSRAVHVATVVLLLVMAMCFTAVTTLYLLDRQDNEESSLLSLTSNITLNIGNGSTSSFSPGPTPVNVPQCTHTVCPAVCCVTSPGKSAPVIPVDLYPLNMSSTTSTPSPSLLPTLSIDNPVAGNIMAATVTSLATTVHGRQHFFPSQERELSSFQSSSAAVRATTTLSTSPMLEKPMIDARMAYDRPSVAKRDVSAVLPVDIILANETLSTDYCVNEACRSQTGSNFTYYIPLHPTMPANASLSIQLKYRSVESSVVLCNETYHVTCPNITSATATKRDNATYDLPVGSFDSSSFTFRVALHSSSISQSICRDASAKLGVDFYEFTFRFQRSCFTRTR